jgi:hypothetical protein
MLTLPAEITSNKNKVSVKPILFIEFDTLNYHIATEDFTFIGSGADGVSTGSTTFDAASALFSTWEIGTGDTITISGTNYTIDHVNSETQLVTDSSITPPGSGKPWSISLKHYYDRLKGGLNLNFDTSSPETIDGLFSVNSIKIQLTQWRTELRTNLVGSTPDLTDQDVNIYLKFNNNTFSPTNSLMIYSGYVDDWEESEDIMNITIKNPFPLNTSYPTELLFDDNALTVAPANTTKPWQYGNFNWLPATGSDAVYRSEAEGGYAACPLHTKSTADVWRYYISDHEMNQVPTSTDFDCEYQELINTYGFVLRNGLMAHASFQATITNGASGAYVDVNVSSNTDIARGCWIFKPFTAAGETNAMVDWADAVDMDKSTNVSMGASATYILSVKGASFADIDEDQFKNAAYVQVFVRYGNIAGDNHDAEYSINGSSWTWSHHVLEADKFTWQELPVGSGFTTFASIANLRFRFVPTGAGSTFLTVVDMIVGVRIKDMIDQEDDCLYLRCKGREYSGTWSGTDRTTPKTAGNLITNPADMIESILRDEFNYSSLNINLYSFDELHDHYEDTGHTADIDIMASIYSKTTAQALLDDICKSFTIGINFNSLRKWSVFLPVAIANNFASSRTDTPAAEDIFTDTDVIVSDAYTNHPILLHSFKLSRSSRNDVYDIVDIEYWQAGYGNYLGLITNGSGNLKKIISNPYILKEANHYLENIREWWQKQKMIANFTTFYNAIAHEIGDVINIRHGDLNDNIIDATVNTQKWMIIRITHKWHPNTIEITAIELP